MKLTVTPPATAGAISVTVPVAVTPGAGFDGETVNDASDIAGFTYGESDEFGYGVVKDGVHVHDMNATILNQLGIDHMRLTYKYQGRAFRLTDVHGSVVKGIIS